MTNVTIDIGNTIISFCMFKKNKLFRHKKIPKDKLNFKVLKNLKNKFFKDKKVKLLISSVVPSSEKIIKSFLKDNLINSTSLKDLLNKIDIETNIKKKKEIGDDRFTNIIYAKKIYKKSVIVIDFGTATTLDVLNSKGVYFGGIITPGIDLSLNVLRYKTAKLPLVKFKKTKKVVGFSTKEAIESGFFWGYCSMIEGLIKRIESEQNESFRIVLTGGNANFFKGIHKKVVLIDEFFTSKAMNYILNEYAK
jgi:type III pantothenate kinase